MKAATPAPTRAKPAAKDSEEDPNIDGLAALEKAFKKSRRVDDLGRLFNAKIARRRRRVK
jgi:hypothetical protein